MSCGFCAFFGLFFIFALITSCCLRALTFATLSSVLPLVRSGSRLITAITARRRSPRRTRTTPGLAAPVREKAVPRAMVQRRPSLPLRGKCIATLGSTLEFYVGPHVSSALPHPITTLRNSLRIQLSWAAEAFYDADIIHPHFLIF